MSPNLLAPFVGRAEELLILSDAFDAASAGQFVPVLVGGEAGIGKTRLVSEFVATLPARTAVHWGRCVEDGGAAPFWPWTQVLLPLTETSSCLAVPTAADRFAGFVGIATLLRDLAVRPIVLVFDDLHVADVDSLELLRFLVRAVADIPVLVIGTHRDHELRSDAERDAILGDVARFGRRLAPQQFDRYEVGELLEGFVGEVVPAAVVDAVLDRTAGNALFVDEMARVLASTGFGSVDVMPDGVLAAVRARLQGVPSRCREALVAAAVLGGRTEWSFIAALLEVSPSELADRLGPAMAIGVIEWQHDGHVAFSHGLIRDAICDDLTPQDLATWHRRAAETLLALHRASPEPYAAAIAQHFASALLVTDATPAAHWASRAAEVARSVHAHEEAAAWSDRSAALYGTLGRLSAQAEELARAADDLGATDSDGSAERARKVTALARLTNSGELLARAARCRALVFGYAREQEAPVLLREALDHPDNAAPNRRRAELLASLTSLLGGPVQSLDGRAPDVAGARAARQELDALIAAGVEARDLLLEALQATEHGPESFGQRHAWLEEYTALGPVSPDPFGWRIRRTFWAASLAFESGRLRELKGHLDDWGHVAEVLGVRYWDWKVAVARASQAFAHGRFAEAEERAMASLVIAGDLYSDMTVRTVGSIVLAVRHEQGRMARYVRNVPLEDLSVAAMLLHIERGETEAVAELVQEQRAEAERPERDIYWLSLMTFLTRGAVFTHDRDTCAWVVDELSPFADQFVMFGRCTQFVGPVAELVGSAAIEAGRPKLAERYLRQALGWAEREDAPGFATRARFALATMLDHCGPAKRKERELLLRQVVEVGSRLGMTGFVAQAETSLDGSASPIELDRATIDPHPLHPSIRTFGTFAVTPAGADEPVRWSSKKARDTLKFLVTRRGAAVSREALIELLWPGIDLARGRSRLSVILTMVRSALDPDRRRGAGYFLRADRDVVSLNAKHLDVDLDRFLEGAADGLRRLRAGDRGATTDLEEALQLAHGGFLVEDRYADWPAATRTEIATTFTTVLRALAAEAQRAGDIDAVVLRLSQLVDRDPYDDEAHDALIAALTAAGRLGDAKRQQVCRTARLDELHPPESD